MSWRRAWRVADRLPDDDPDRMSMHITPRTLLCGTAFRVGRSGADTGFEELLGLCTAADDQRSLAIGMGGLVAAKLMTAHRREASSLANELVRLLESIGDPTLTVALLTMAIPAKHETREMAEVLRLAQEIIDLAEGDPTKANLVVGSPLALAIAMRGMARWRLGIAGWKDDRLQAVAMAVALDPATRVAGMWYAYVAAIAYGVLLPDTTALRDTAETLAIAQQSGDDFALFMARTTRGVTLLHQDGPEREAGLDLLAKTRETARDERFSVIALPVIKIHIAREGAARRS